MRVAILQPNYVPWRGYFDFIDEVDVFVVYDDVQYTKGDWRNRNRIKTAQGLRWMTVPVHHHLGQRICDTAVAYSGSRNWRRDHLNLIEANLSAAPYVADVRSMLSAEFERGHRTISDLNVGLIKTLCRYLHIDTPLRFSSEFTLHGAKTERLIELLTTIGATTYVSGPSASAYLDEARFREARIRLEYKTYDYANYPQLHGAFDPGVSILDLIANCGPHARRWLLGSTRNQLAVA
jgi:WbqC-like protein